MPSALLKTFLSRTLSQLIGDCYISRPSEGVRGRINGFNMSGEVRHSPLALANTFVARYAPPAGITHMKVQKLCYFAHGWWLAFSPEPFLTERPEVWKFGPVFASLYSVLSHHGSRGILIPEKAQFHSAAPVLQEQSYLDLVDWIWNRYGHHSAMTLSDMTHAEGTPWRIVAERYNFRVPKHFELPDSDVAAYFKAEAEAFQPA